MLREELRGIQIEAHALAEALNCNVVEKHEFILFLLIGLPLELQQIKFSCELLCVKRGAASITRLGAPEDLQLWPLNFMRSRKKTISALIETSVLLQPLRWMSSIFFTLT